MNLLNNLEKMQDARMTRLNRIAIDSGRYWSTMNDPFIQANVREAIDENNKAEAEYHTYK